MSPVSTSGVGGMSWLMVLSKVPLPLRSVQLSSVFTWIDEFGIVGKSVGLGLRVFV